MKTTFAKLFLILSITLPLRGAELTSIESRPSSARSSVSAQSTSETAATVAKAWPHEASDLKPDAKAIFGKLDNGLRYVIYPTKQAPTRASLRLYMDVGTLMEADDQRGMAHFLEHMGFNTTKHYAVGEKVEFLQRLGMKMGADTNAFTSLDKTIYMLELPRANEELLGDGFKLFHDFLDGMSLTGKDLEKERPIILGEIVQWDSAEERASRVHEKFEFPNALLSRRNVLGDVGSIRSLKRERFVDFYETWYTPRRATVVAVGDFDVKLVERLIRDGFADVKARRGEQPNPDLGQITASNGIEARLYSDAELSGCSVKFSVMRSFKPAADTLARERQDMIRGLAAAMLNTRLERIARAENAPFQAAGIAAVQELGFCEENFMRAICQPTRWKAALQTMEQELRRALQYGFTDAEFEEAKKIGLASQQIVAQNADNREPSTLAAEIIGKLKENEVFMHPADIEPLVKQLFDGITRTECEQALREVWNTANIRIWVQGNIRVEGNGDEQVATAMRESRELPVTPPADVNTGKLTYTDFGPAGEIVKRNELTDLGVVQAVFANNVRVNVKHTSFAKNQALIDIRIGGGRLETPAQKPELRFFANSCFVRGGLEAHSFDELLRIIADKQVGLLFQVEDDAFAFQGGCGSDMLETQLQLLTAYITAPGYRDESRKAMLAALDETYANWKHTAEGALGTSGAAFLRSNDPRFQPPARESLEQRTMDDLRNWLMKPLKEGYLEATIVGDVDPDQVLKLVAKTLGALPQRAAEKPAFAEARKLQFPATPKTKEIRFESTLPRAELSVSWPTTGTHDPAVGRRLRLLASILSDRLRLKIREELGATYTPSASHFGSDVFTDYGFLEADIVVDPSQVDEIGKLVAEIGNSLATTGIGDDEFDRAFKPGLSNLERAQLDNTFWMLSLSDIQENPMQLDNIRHQVKDYQSITKDELAALAKTFLPAEKATIMSAVPSGKAE